MISELNCFFHVSCLEKFGEFDTWEFKKLGKYNKYNNANQPGLQVCKKLVGLRASCGACMDIKNLLMILQGCKEPCIRTLMQETA